MARSNVVPLIVLVGCASASGCDGRPPAAAPSGAVASGGSGTLGGGSGSVAGNAGTGIAGGGGTGLSAPGGAGTAGAGPGGAGAGGSGSSGVGGAPGLAGIGASAGTGGTSSLEKHALIIGVDGLGSNQINNARTPNLDMLIAGNAAFSYTAFAGGVRGSASEQETSSGPGWTSILTGVWAKDHGVLTNVHVISNNLGRYPPLCKRLHEVAPSAFCSSIVRWKPINDFIINNADHEAIGASDQEVRSLVIAHLTNANPVVLFVHFDELDEVGHAHGSDSNQYRDKLTDIDGHVGALVSAIKSRPNAAAEDWMVLVVSDHGHKVTGGHGGQSDDERLIPFINSSSGAVKGEVRMGPGHVAVPPTVFAHLGLTPGPNWDWAAQPFGMR